MKNENIIVALIFLVIVALFAFNFTKLTGFATQKEDTYAPTINLYKTDINENKIKAKTVDGGEVISVEIKINKGCINPLFKIYPVRNGIVGTRKASKYYSPDIGDCARISSRGSKIPCGSSKYCKDDLKLDTIRTTFDTRPDWKGKYILRVPYYDEKGNEKFKDSEEFTVS